MTSEEQAFIDAAIKYMDSSVPEDDLPRDLITAYWKLKASRQTKIHPTETNDDK